MNNNSICRASRYCYLYFPQGFGPEAQRPKPEEALFGPPRVYIQGSCVGSMGSFLDLMKLGAHCQSRVLGRVSPLLQGQKYTPITIWPALRFQRNQINSLGNGRDSDLKQIENAFKYPEDGFWEKNSSKGIVRNSELYQKFEASVVQLQLNS